jgi:transposase-like protein
MIRYFAALCKPLIKICSDEKLFLAATGRFKYYNERCPRCGALGKLSPFGYYFRHLVSNNGSVPIIEVSRYRCSSCNTTHALLPAVLVPFSPYSLSFMLTVLAAYFERKYTVAAICERFHIAVSTLYAWKNRFLEHLNLLVGLLASHQRPFLDFIRDLLQDVDLSVRLSAFFLRYTFSFMQNWLVLATRSRSP